MVEVRTYLKGIMHDGRWPVVVLALWAFLEALQLLFLLCLAFSFIPVHYRSFAREMFPVYWSDIRPEREMFFYRAFVVCAIVLQAAFVWQGRRLQAPLARRHLQQYLAVAGIWIFLQIFAAFKIFIFGDPAWARYLLYASTAGAVVTRLFWPELCRLVPWLAARGRRLFPASAALKAWDCAFALLLIAVLAVPDIDRALARIFTSDKFFHLDRFLMAPAWAHLNGLVLNKDVISEYGVALPAVLGQILARTGGFDYGPAIVLIISTAIAYYLLAYTLLRRWLCSRAIATFGTLLAVKLQLFHWGVLPLVWRFPSATPLRYFPDVFFLLCILSHIRSGRKVWLWAAAVITGVSLAWVIDAGVYMLGALLVYTLAHAYERRLPLAAYFQMPLTVLLASLSTAGLILWSLQGNLVFDAAYWSNHFEYVRLFLQGWGGLPMTDGLKEKQFFAFIMGFIIPVVYVWTLIIAAALCFLRRGMRENLFVLVVCVYGLGLYHYFIYRSAVTSYYVVCLPFVFIVCFWLSQLLASAKAALAVTVKAVLIAGVLGALLTGFLFMHYPNALNLSGLDWTGEKDTYRRQFDFTQDAALIGRLTSPQQKVPVIANSEVRILMQAGRKPFFYYFPVIESHVPVYGLAFTGTFLITASSMEKTLDQLSVQKPPYIFVEKQLLEGPEALKARAASETFRQLLDYVQNNYAAAEQGQHLVAMKLK